MDDEIWKIVDEAPKFLVSNHGRVQNRTTGRMIKSSPSKNGYLKVNLSCDGKYFQRMIHRLVALAFVPKVEGKEEVKPIDGNKHNLHHSNLEWVFYQISKTPAKKLRTWVVEPDGSQTQIS